MAKMKFLPYILVAILLIGSVIFVMTSTNSNSSSQIIPTAIPTPTVNQHAESSVFGESVQEIPEARSATILTTKGEIVIELFNDAAPLTVTNFSDKAKSGYFDNLIFHRVEGWVIQGGDPLGTGMGGGQMPTELNNNPFIRGSVGVARGGNIEISNDSQFFITKTDSPHLDQLYTNFGQVSSGLSVVDTIEIGDKILSITIE